MSGPFKVAAVQAAPVFLDMAATAQKAVALIDEAGKAGAKLIAFPETWLPGYPWWIWLAAPAHGMPYVGRYHANSPVAGGPEDKAIADAARRNQIHVVLGLSEKVGGSLYMAQWIYGPDGVVIARRKKLKPTHVERTVFGEGDGSDLEVFDTAIGRVGALCCWEHLQPLTKYAMYSMNEQIHIASWPSFSLYRGMAYALGPELNTAASQMYAAEGQCFVIASCATVSDEMVEMLCDAPDKQMFLKAGGGFSRVFGPDGAPIGDGLPETKEGLVIAEIDLGMISIAKSAADPAGHYSRPDVTRLLLNRRPSPRVMSFEDQPREVAAEQAGIPAGVEDSRRRAVG